MLNLSQGFLLATRSGAPTDRFVADLAAIDLSALEADLDRDPARIAFWVNAYNAYFQHQAALEPRRRRGVVSFFGDRQFVIGGHRVSLNMIEHGILRRGRPMIGLGYFANPFRGSFVRRFQVDRVDPRIHFALNCGAISCPPIRFYEVEALDGQLEMATRSYLTGEVEYVADQGIIHVPGILRAFRGDFGGRSGILALLVAHEMIPDGATPAFRWRSFDAGAKLGQWADPHG